VIVIGKNPAFQFYPGDWIQDTRILTPLTRGVWVDMLCFMWRSEDRGRLEMTYQQYARLLSCEQVEIKSAITELSVTKIADVTVCNDLVTMINRRMYREERERKLTRSRVAKYREMAEKRKSNAPVTLPSSSSSSIKNNTMSSVIEIIDFLNLKSGKNFSHKAKATISHISARLKEGKTIDDFKKVITIKCEKWMLDPKMCDFVRPETLFGSKFESYCNEYPPQRKASW